MSDKELILNLWREGLSVTDIARRVGGSRGKVSGMIYRHRDDGFVHTKRGYYENPRRAGEGMWQWDRETPFSHAADTQREHKRRNTLKELLQ